VLLALSLFGLVTCARVPSEPPPREPESPAVTETAGARPAAPSSAEEEDRRLAAEVPLWLPNFYAALHDLRLGKRQEHVRVLWLGDSHTAADFWTDSVRQPLQSRFGEGGAGLVLLGLRMYRHGMANLSRTGKWRTMPRTPSATQPHRDGALGLGGQAAAPISRNATARIELARTLDWAKGPLRWQVLYRLPHATSRFTVRSGTEVAVEVTEGAGEMRASGLHGIMIETQGSLSLSFDGFVDEPELFGVIVEGGTPGVVVDTLGINGARAATPLAWDADAWIEEVKARDPSLVVLSYGTNEAGDTALLSVYEEHYGKLLERLRAGAPHSDCLIVGPTDRVGRDWVSMPRVQAIDEAQRRIASELRCAFFSPLDAMGGPGGLKRWAFGKPKLARRDRVHLLPSGYRQLGGTMAEELFSSFEARYPEESVAR
jgi:lysophospholipase L1-like esterase